MEEAEVPYFIAVGRALTAWGGVEAKLGMLYAICLTGGKLDQVALVAYWAIISFEAKLGAADAAIGRRLKEHPDLADEWNAIRNRLIKKNKNRNKLAHGQVVTGIVPGTLGSAPPVEMETFFAPYFSAQVGRLEYYRDPIDTLSDKEIDDIRVSFEQVQGRLSNLYGQVKRALVPPTPFDPPNPSGQTPRTQE